MPAPLAGQVAITGTAQALAATTVNSVAFIIKASANNANSVYIGPSTVTTANGYELAPGDTFEYEQSSAQGRPSYQLRVSDFSAIGTAGSDRLTWLASPLP